MLGERPKVVVDRLGEVGRQSRIVRELVTSGTEMLLASTREIPGRPLWPPARLAQVRAAEVQVSGTVLDEASPRSRVVAVIGEDPARLQDRVRQRGVPGEVVQQCYELGGEVVRHQVGSRNR